MSFFYTIDYYLSTPFEEFEEYFINEILKKKISHSVKLIENSHDIIEVVHPYFVLYLDKTEEYSNWGDIITNYNIYISIYGNHENEEDDIFRILNEMIKKYHTNCRLDCYDTPIVKCKDGNVTVSPYCIEEGFPVHLFEFQYDVDVL